MRAFLSLLLLGAALPAAAQYAPPNDQTVLYGVKKNQMPQGVVIEQGAAAPGIPTSGTQQMQQLKQNQPGYYNAPQRGPNVIYRDRKDKGLTVITGPDGTTVCRDVSGRVTVCN
ncbi:hypothetical protein [Azospira restricta]|uniref:Secreted protein n=1 Tax=Azospira restricta TaxID=404405 RepID=A0A974PVF0_9RHOO|nr:hypothetical protein [Azospira restricta]QRJ62234.1 hypothetical protein IWH25_10535 [Azospira restricta]